MSDYYIRITDEEPVEMEKGVRFKYDGTGSESDFVIVEQNAYRALVENFEMFSQSTESIINYNLDNLLENKDIPLSRASYGIVDENKENIIDHEQLTDIITSYVSSNQFSEVEDSISSISSTIESIQNSIASLESTKATIAQLNSLQSSINSTLGNYYTKAETNNLINGRSPSNHTHTGWTSVKFNDYCSGYYNSSIRIVVMRYLRRDYNFKNTSTVKIHSGLFKNFKPIIGGDVILPCYYGGMAYVDNATGDFSAYSEKTGSRTISTSGIWRY